MWLFFAAGSAFFAGITAVLSKCGVRRTDSDVATAVSAAVLHEPVTRRTAAGLVCLLAGVLCMLI